MDNTEKSGGQAKVFGAKEGGRGGTFPDVVPIRIAESRVHLAVRQTGRPERGDGPARQMLRACPTDTFGPARQTRRAGPNQ